MKRYALVGAVIVSLTYYAATYWGAAEYGETSSERLRPQATGQAARAGEENFIKEKEEGLGHEASSGRSGDTRADSGELPGSVEGRTEHGRNVQAAVREPRKGHEKASNVFSADRPNLTDYAYSGTYKLTAYTADFESTGKSPGDPAYGITYSGMPVEKGVTVAADLNVLPLGTVVYIEGIGKRTVRDKGGAVKGKHLDIYIEDLEEALAFGVQEAAVYVIEWGPKE